MSIFIYCILLVTGIAFCFVAVTVAASIVFRGRISLKKIMFVEIWVYFVLASCVLIGLPIIYQKNCEVSEVVNTYTIESVETAGNTTKIVYIKDGEEKTYRVKMATIVINDESEPQRLEVVKTQWKNLSDINYRIYIHNDI